MSSTSKLMFTPYTDANDGVTGTPIELVFESGRTDGWDELTDGDVALPPGNPDGNINFIAWNAPNTALTGGKVYTLNGDSLAERSFEIRVENGGANLFIEFDSAELIANFEKVVILDATAPALPPGSPVAFGLNATIDLLTESRSGAYTTYPGYYEFTTSSTGKRRIGIVSSLQYFIQVIPKAGGVSDTTAPVITLNGDATVNHEVGQSYSDAGAIATDDTDQSPTISITITKDGAAFNDGITAIGNAVGEYIITYSAQDAAENTATPVTRTVTVADTLDPTMELQGDATVTITVGQSYSDAGVIPGDNYDQSPTISITITKDGAAFNDGITAIGNAIGTYVITYTASDAAGNTATPVTRTVTVEADTTAPVINLNGQSSSNHEVGTAYADTATATDETDANVTSSMTTTITKDGAAFNDDISTIGYVTGTYVITYNVSDAAGNAATPVTRTVTVADTLAPTMVLQGASTITLTVGQSYSDAGATATDTFDGTVTVTITITKDGAAFNDGITEIGNAVGEYIIAYDASDADGNPATQVTRTVNVEAAPVADTTAPVINLNGASTITLTVGQTYTELVSATDNVDGTVTVTITITKDGAAFNDGITEIGNAVGEYIITYSAQDAAGNTATEVTRTVNVEAANDTTWGDITNDGSIGAADVVYLASYLAGESGFIHGGPSAPAS